MRPPIINCLQLSPTTPLCATDPLEDAPASGPSGEPSFTCMRHRFCLQGLQPPCTHHPSSKHGLHRPALCSRLRCSSGHLACTAVHQVRSSTPNMPHINIWNVSHAASLIISCFSTPWTHGDLNLTPVLPSCRTFWPALRWGPPPADATPFMIAATAACQDVHTPTLQDPLQSALSDDTKLCLQDRPEEASSYPVQQRLCHPLEAPSLDLPAPSSVQACSSQNTPGTTDHRDGFSSTSIPQQCALVQTINRSLRMDAMSRLVLPDTAAAPTSAPFKSSPLHSVRAPCSVPGATALYRSRATHKILSVKVRLLVSRGGRWCACREALLLLSCYLPAASGPMCPATGFCCCRCCCCACHCACVCAPTLQPVHALQIAACLLCLCAPCACTLLAIKVKPKSADATTCLPALVTITHQ